MSLHPDYGDRLALDYLNDALARPGLYGIIDHMSISLTPEQQARLSAYVARGDFASLEDAARQLIDERMAERALEEADSLAWAKPDVDEALEDVARGNLLSRDEHRARNAVRLAALKG